MEPNKFWFELSYATTNAEANHRDKFFQGTLSYGPFDTMGTACAAAHDMIKNTYILGGPYQIMPVYYCIYQGDTGGYFTDKQIHLEVL